VLVKEFSKGFVFALIVMVLFFSNPAFAYSFEASSQKLLFAEPTLFETGTEAGTVVQEVSPTTDPVTIGTTPQAETTTQTDLTSLGSPTGCTVSKLTPKEAMDILDIAHSGFQGEKISDGTAPDKNNLMDLNGTQLVTKDNDGKTAIKVTPPTQATSASKYALFDGRTLSGPFGIGLVLDDTLRVGKCDYPTSEQDKCRIEGNGTEYRTSGTGLQAGFGNAFESLKDAASRKIQGVSEEEYQSMQNNFLDNNQDNLISYTLSPSDKIKNSFFVGDYTVKKATNCTGATCIISTYSSFDKYFNSWFSAEMIVSSFGPTLLHKASKVMGWGGAAGGAKNTSSIWNKTGTFFEKQTNRLKKFPLEALGTNRFEAYNKIRLEYPQLRQIFDKMLVDRKLFNSSMGGLSTELLKSDSVLMKLNPEEKKAFFKALDHLRSWFSLQNSEIQGLKAAYDAVAKSATATVAEKQLAQMEFGRAMAYKIGWYDRLTSLDFPAWLQTSGSLSDMSNLVVKKKAFGVGGAAGGVVNMGTEKPFNVRNFLLDPLYEDGSWSRFINSQAGDALEVDNLGNLLLYEIKKDGKLFQQGVAVDDLLKHVGQNTGTGILSIKLPSTGELYELNEATIKLLEKNPSLGSTVDLYVSGYGPKMIIENGVSRQAVLTPQELAQRITQDRIVGRPNTAVGNMDDMVNALRENPEFAQRRAWSLYDEQIRMEKDFIFDYYKKPWSVGIWKGTLLPIAYWNVKRGLGFEQVSGYMLPDTWSTLDITTGTDEIYADSYVDFYANEGSDQGDLFMKFINSAAFVWKFVADQFTKEEFPLYHDYLTRASGSGEGVQTSGAFSKSITRDTVQDVAFYSHNENCSGCSATPTMQDNYFTFTARMPTNIQAFLVEAVDPDTAQKSGTTLIAFAHHADIQGKTGDIKGDQINIADARVEGETCEQALKGIGFGWADSRVVGGTLAFGESLGYFMGFGAGITATVVQQLMLTRKLQDCVDDIDGYYIHFFSPASASKAKPKEAVSNESISQAVSNLSTKLADATAKSDSPIADSLDKLKGDFQNFATQAKNDEVLQANIQLLPPSQGTVTGKELFYLWYKEASNPIAYKTDGKQVVTDGNNKLEIDFADGTLSFNGKEVLGSDKADHTRMATTPSDNRIPGIVIPATLNKIGAPMTGETVFELHAGGDVLVRNAEVLDCIRKAVKDQTGIEYTGDELTQVFGKLEGVNTQTYSKVFAADGKIYLEGVGPRIQGGINSLFVIDGYWQSRLIVDSAQSADAGKFKGMAFEHGSIVLKEETNEIIIWLRQHKESVLSNKEVSGLNAKLDSVIDPNSDCPVPAINLEAIGYPGDELGQQRVKNFNTSMDHLGPFTQFVTDSKIYEFYARRDGDTGACKDYFRIIDKNSGKVLYDSEIKGGVKQAEDGTLNFETADGKQHSLKFDAENGVPKVSYNEGPKETLRAAQGPNGSFWYDPNTGLWYPENGLQIPLSQAFKDNGAMFASDGKGGVVGTPVNPMTFNIGSQTGQGFNIPSLPETAAGLILFIAAFLMISFTLTHKKKRKK